MSGWAAEVVVGAAAARRLIDSQFPELESARIELLGEGWDMTVYLVGGRHVFRFPRREVVVPGLRRELEVLPRLAPALPLAIPVPELVGRPGDGYPWPFYGAPLIPGAEVGRAGLEQAELDALAPLLGRFLRVLHSQSAPAGLPADPNRRADIPLRASRVREALTRLEIAGVWSRRTEVEPLLRDAEGLAPADERVLTHGDLHLRHLLVDGGRASGVIDWIDVCVAPREIDFPLYWSLFSDAGRRGFRRAYGELDDGSLRRSRVLALNLCSILADYAHTEGVDWLLRAAVAGLDRTLG